MSEFPGNPKSPQPSPSSKPEKNVEQVVTTEVKSQKKGLGRRFQEMFIGGDSKSVVEYIVTQVIVPQIRDLIAEAATQGFERLIYGESRSSTTRRPVTHQTNYSRYAQRGNNPVGRYGREERVATPNASLKTSRMEDILFASRHEADMVIEKMYDLLNGYEMVSVADLYSLIGWSSTHTDHKWGWLEMQGFDTRKTRDGWVLIVPKPQSLEY